MMCKANPVPTVKEIMPPITSQAPEPLLCARRMISDNPARYMHKALDRWRIWDIIIFTHDLRDSGDLFNVRRHGQKVQARRPEAERRPESPRGIRDRPFVSNWRFLRSRRPRTDQVRDASPGESGQAVSQPVRFVIRLFTPDLLSSGRRLSARRPVRSIAREARTQARSQTHAGDFGLRGPTPCERFFAPRCRSGCCHPGTVRYHCPPTQHRTRFGAAGKKTSLNPSGGGRNAAEPQTLISAYEDLRQQAAAHSSSGGLGMALFLGQGMVAWMQACSWVASTNPHKSRDCPTTTAPLPVDVRGEIVLVLAAMALRRAPEVHP